MQKKGGYGIVYKCVLTDPTITIEAKAVYAYLAGYAGVSDECFPSISLICDELCISKTRLYKHMNLLVDAGVVEKIQTYNGNIKGKVIYRITHNIVSNFSVSEKLGIREIRNPQNKEINNNTFTNNKVDYQLIADMYNSTCVSFPKLTKLSEKRKKAIKARLNTYTIDDFKKLFEMAESSSFLKGQNNRNWSATFDWLIQDANAAKILDGNYADKPKTQGKEMVGYESASSIKLWE